MTLGIVVFGAAFLVGLALGTYTRRPLSTMRETFALILGR